MSRIRQISFGVSIVWICASTLQITGFGKQILFEQRNGATEWLKYSLLVFWIGVLALSVWSCWMTRKVVEDGDG